MSAFDIAGAVVWTPLAGLFIYGMLRPETKPDATLICMVLAIGFTLASAFCISRLFGAGL